MKNQLTNTNIKLLKFLEKHKPLFSRSEVYVSLVTLSTKVGISAVFYLFWGEESALVFLSQLGILYMLIAVLYFINYQRFEFYVDKYVVNLFKHSFFIRFFSVPFSFFFIVLYTRYRSAKDIKEEVRNKFRFVYYSYFMLYAGFFPSFFFIFCPRFMFLAYILFFVNFCKFVLKSVNFDTSYLVLNFEMVRDLLDHEDLANKEIFSTSKFLELPEQVRYVYSSVYESVVKGSIDGLPLLFFLLSLFKKYESYELSLLLNKSFTNSFIIKTEEVVQESINLQHEHVFRDFPPVTQNQILMVGGIVGFFRNVGQGVATGAGTAVVAVATWLTLQHKDSERREEERKKDIDGIRKVNEEAIVALDNKINEFKEVNEDTKGAIAALDSRISEFKKVKEQVELLKRSLDSSLNVDSLHTSTVKKSATQKDVDQAFKSANEAASGLNNGVQKHPSVFEDEYLIIKLLKQVGNVVLALFGF
jgi:hypothetical protein